MIITIFNSCDYAYVDDDQFIGVWELKGRTSFNNMQVEIFRDKGKLKGKIIQLSDSKVVKMFAEEGDIWVKNIKRTSNFSFKLTESKIAAELFSMYNISTSNEFKVEFIDKNKIGLANDGSDPLKSNIFYERIK